ncbi:MAG: beta-lactamase family protein [Labilithrix sp.]|nr:beta-lactamase family protein [Labilithrix sp.]
MRARWSLFLTASAFAASCGGPGSGHVPEGSVAAKEADGGGIVPTDERQRLHDRLATAIAPLVDSPFGTAAAATGVVGTVEGAASLGTLWDGGPSATNDSRFNVASVSKVLTAARIVSLAHAKSIGLDDAVSKHLPGVKLLDEGGVDRAGTITVRQLVQHRSGLPHVPKDLERRVANRWSSPDLLRVLTDSWELALDGSPGQYKYSNTGYALLGAIIERTRNCSFADCMATYLDELGMTRSTFWPTTLGDDAARGRVVVQGAAKFNEPGWYASRYALPFTGLWTSTPDLARFGAIVLSASKDPAAPLHAMSAPDGNPLGLFVAKRLDATSLEHDGSGPGFHASLIILPSKSVVLAMATNGGNETKDEGAAFADVVRSTLNVVPAP